MRTHPTRFAESRWAAASLLLLTLALLGLSATTTGAAEPDTRPRLEEHNFLISDLNPAPFVRTFLRTTVGYAQASDLSYGTVVINGDTLATLDGNLAYAALSVEFQHAIKKWIAFWLRTTLRSRLGTDATALLVDGVQVTGDFELGWLLRLHEAGPTALSASLVVNRSSATIVDIDQFVDDILAGADDPQLVDTIPILRSRGGVHFAWALNRTLGLISEANLSYGDQAGRDRGAGFEYAYGASLDYDISAVSTVPLGASVGFRQSSLPDLGVDATDIIRVFSFQLGYNTKPDFMVSLDMTHTISRDSRINESVRASGAALTLRYYF